MENKDILKNLCEAIEKFGAEQERRGNYVLIYLKYKDNVRSILHEINNSSMKAPFEAKWSAILDKDRDNIMNFIRNGNGADDEADEEYN